MQRAFIAVVTLVSCFFFTDVANARTASCSAPELAGRASYDELVCSGISRMAQQDYKQAVELFEKAMNVPLLDAPNFQLYPRLALAYFHLGDRDKASALLKKAELSLMVVTRVLNCEESGPSYVIARNIWRSSAKIDSPYHDEVAARMCGAAYEGIYHPEKLEEIVGETVLVRNYLEIKKEIEGGK